MVAVVTTATRAAFHRRLTGLSVIPEFRRPGSIVVVFDGVSFVDVLNGKRPVKEVNLTTEADGDVGYYCFFADALDPYVQLGATTSEFEPGTSDFLFGCIVMEPTDTTGFIPLATRTSSTSVGYDLLCKAESVPGRWRTRIQTDTGLYESPNRNWALDEWHHYFAFRSGSICKEFIDGQGTSFSIAGSVTNAQPLYIGRRNITYGNFNLPIAFYIHGLSLPDSDAAWLTEDLFRIFQPPRTWFLLGAGGTTYTRTISADTLIQQQNILRTASADAMVAKVQQLGAFADALVQLAAQLNISADALLQGTNAQQALADLLVQVQQSVSAAADLRIASVQQLQALADALLQATNSRAAQADLLLQARQALGTSADLLVRMTAELVASADMIVQSSGATTYLRTAVVDMLVEKLQQLAVQADLLLQRQGATVVAQADVAVAVRQALSATADALVQQSQAAVLQANALLRSTVRALAQVDALLQVPRTASLSADLRVVLRALLSVGCNVLVRATRQARVGVDLLALLPPGVWKGESAAAPPAWTADSGALSPWTLETGKSDSWN